MTSRPWEITTDSCQEILVYSIADDLWYTQTATGDVPEERRRFCAGLAYAEDRSSYNMYDTSKLIKLSLTLRSYLYGGASIGDGVGYGDVYILSLPSFTWIKVSTALGLNNKHATPQC
jgi:hypothetical protein